MYINRCNTTTTTTTTIRDFQLAVMDDGAQHHGGVRRSRAPELTTADSGKRPKFNPPEAENAAVVRLDDRCRSGVDGGSPEDVASSLESGDRVSSSSCVQNDLSSDLKVEIRFETETSVCGNGGFSREASSSSEICLDSDEMEASSTLKKKKKTPLPTATSSGRQPSPAANIPSPAEIDEFFTIIEKKEQQRFADKYNYDIVNDVPMEGRYQWVRLKP